MEAEAEIEALRSIFGEDIVVETIQDKSVTVVRKKVRPNDEEGVSSASVVVEFELSEEYPEVSPKVRLLNPRGISEESHQQLIEEVRQRLADNIGMPIIFDILQHCADFVFEHQHSSSLSCPICLCPMTAASVSVTPCDHYAHTECLQLHCEHTKKQLGEKLAARDFKMCDDIDRSLHCPVCREVIEEEVEPILPRSSPPRRGRKAAPRGRESTPCQLSLQEAQDDFDFDWGRWREQQASLMKIYERQKEKGGIIDLEEERKKNLITEDTVVVLASEMENVPMDRPEAETAAPPPEETNTHLTSADLDVPPGFENATHVHATTAVSSKGVDDHLRRGRGRGRRPYGDRQRERGRYDYRAKQRREINEKRNESTSVDPRQNESHSESHSSHAICDNKATFTSGEDPPQQSGGVSRAESTGFSRGNGTARHYQHQRGHAHWRDRGPKQRNSNDRNTHPLEKVE
ncbi:RWD domain protein [Ancylostoma caninum]|uniref:RWD domain protein n=1 Tax=Ancylostoma caninum TaxID=29170 RepID=A0A368H7X8_ANCCA|nr:RWD domain protein [Ancylostoma caninum]